MFMLAWATPLKSKSAKEVSRAMSKILLKRAPKLLQLDNGKELYNSTFDALMEKHNIHKYSTYSTMKACIVEHFNRTLKEKMFREFTARGGSHERICILPLLIYEYNNSKHRTIGMTPVEADANPTKEKFVAYTVANAMKAKRKIGMDYKRKRGIKTNDILTVKKKRNLKKKNGGKRLILAPRQLGGVNPLIPIFAGMSALFNLMSGGANVYNAVQNSKRKEGSGLNNNGLRKKN
ncbi:hypothetical protein QTP88_017597 [Uroleucon formosanum]